MKKHKRQVTRAAKAAKQASEPPKESRKEPNIWLIISSMLFALFGIFYVFFAIMLAMMPSLAMAFGFQPLIGAAIISLGSLVCFIAAIGLWQAKKYGGITGGIFVALNIISAVPSLITMPSPGTLIGIIVEAAMLSLIAANWKHLK